MAQPDWFDRGVQIGSAYHEGQDANAKRGRLTAEERRKDVESADVSGIRQQQARGLKMGNDELQLQTDRKRTLESGLQAAWGAGGPPKPTAAGNIDLKNRPVVKNADGSISTIRSVGVNLDGKETLLPTIGDDGRELTTDEAVEVYRKTGKHLGQFNTPEEATTFAKGLSMEQGQRHGAMPAPPNKLQKAQRARAEVAAYLSVSDTSNAHKKEAEAEVLEMEHIYDEGAALADREDMWDKVSTGVTNKSKYVMMGKDPDTGRDRLVVQSPNGKLKFKDLSIKDRQHVFGAFALINAGHKAAGFAKLAAVDANLAVAAQTENEQTMKVSGQNMKTEHEAAQDKTGARNADANMMSAGAAASNAKTNAGRLGLEKTKAAQREAFGPTYERERVVNGKVETVTMQGYRDADGKIAYEEVPMPEGTRPKGTVTLKETKLADGSVIFRDSVSGRPLWRQTPEGDEVPPGKDPLGRADGKPNDKQAKLEAEGILISAQKNKKTGEVGWRYVVEETGEDFDTPEQAKAAAKKAMPTTPAAGKKPASGVRGLSDVLDEKDRERKKNTPPREPGDGSYAAP
jgi:hypothetical protein